MKKAISKTEMFNTLKSDNKQAASLANTIASLAIKSAEEICVIYDTDKTGNLSFDNWNEAREICANGYNEGYAERMSTKDNPVSVEDILKNDEQKKKMASARNNHMSAIRKAIEESGVVIKASDKADSKRKAVSRADKEKAQAKAEQQQQAYQAIEARMKKDPTLSPSMAALELTKGDLGKAAKMEKDHKRANDLLKKEQAAAHKSELDELKKNIDSELKRLWESINIPNLKKALTALKKIK